MNVPECVCMGEVDKSMDEGLRAELREFFGSLDRVSLGIKTLW